MTEKLQREAERRGVAVYDRQLAVSIIKHEGKAAGLLTMDLTAGEKPHFTLFNCRNIIFATGGPGGIYQDSVYPACHNGANGILFEAGAQGAEFDGMAVWLGLGKPALECFRHLYAGAAAVCFRR